MAYLSLLRWSHALRSDQYIQVMMIISEIEINVDNHEHEEDIRGAEEATEEVEGLDDE